MTETVIQKSIHLRATPAQVWAWLTDPEKLEIWFHKPDKALVEGEYTMHAADTGDMKMWGEVLVAEPFNRLEYTFVIPPMGDKVSTISWSLEEVPGGTKLSMIHSGLPQGAEAYGLMLALDEGWDEHIKCMRDGIRAS